MNQERLKLAGADLPAEVLGTKLAAVRRAIDLWFVHGFRAVMWGASLLALAGGLAAWRFTDRRSASPADQPRRVAENGARAAL